MKENKDLMSVKKDSLENTDRYRTVSAVVDVYENEEEILLHADMPGVQKEDIAIEFDNGKLDISGVRNLTQAGSAQWEEFSTIRYQRTFSVPQSIQVNNINAQLRNGVLVLHLPKTEEAKPRKIEIATA